MATTVKPSSTKFSTDFIFEWVFISFNFDGLRHFLQWKWQSNTAYSEQNVCATSAAKEMRASLWIDQENSKYRLQCKIIAFIFIFEKLILLCISVPYNKRWERWSSRIPSHDGSYDF
jgi:hypothetical protein